MGVAAGRQRGTEIGVAFTIWLVETANYITAYIVAIICASIQSSAGLTRFVVAPQVQAVQELVIRLWQTNNARVRAGNFTLYELDLVDVFRKTGAISGFGAGQSIGPAIGETSGKTAGGRGVVGEEGRRRLDGGREGVGFQFFLIPSLQMS